MGELKDRIVQLIEQNAAKKVSRLTTEFINAEPSEKEEILAAIDFERWLSYPWP